MSQQEIRRQLDVLDKMLKWHDLEGEALVCYKHLQRVALLAELEVEKFLDTLAPERLTDGEREQIIQDLKHDHEAVTHGDGMCLESAEQELREMSDWELLHYKDFKREADTDKV